MRTLTNILAISTKPEHLQPLLLSLKSKDITSCLFDARVLLRKYYLDVHHVRELVSLITNADVILVDSPHMSLYIAFFITRVLRGRKPLLIRLRGVYWEEFHDWKISSKMINPLILTDHVVSHGDLLLPNCNFLASRLGARLRKCRLETLYNGVDLDRFKERASTHKMRFLYDHFIIVPTNFNIARKFAGLLYFLPDIYNIAKKMDVNVVVLGANGPLKNTLTEMIRMRGWQTVFHVTYVKDIASLLSLCEAVIYPSWQDCFPQVILESAAAGKAILATNVGGIPEILQGQCGIMIEMTDRRAFRSGMIRLLEDSNLRRRLGSSARSIISKYFIWNAISQRFLAILKQNDMLA